MASMVPQWLTVLSIVYLSLAGACSLVIIIDLLAGHAQKMAIMNVVWPVTALYFGPFALMGYYLIGRKSTRKKQEQQGGRQQGPQKPFWQITYVGDTHCGAGCTLGDILGESIVYWTNWTIGGIALWPEYIADYALAYMFGIAFQYFSIVPMRKLPVLPGIWAAIKADTLSLTAFEVGLFGWMALMRFVFFSPPLHPGDPTFWFMMQVGMIAGFATSYPMNWWLIRWRIKEPM